MRLSKHNISDMELLRLVNSTLCESLINTERLSIGQHNTIIHNYFHYYKNQNELLSSKGRPLFIENLCAPI